MTDPYTLEAIQAHTDALRAELAKRRQGLRAHYHEIFAPPAPSNNKVETLVRRASTAYAIFDGFWTGYKMLRVLFGGRRKKR